MIQAFVEGLEVHLNKLASEEGAKMMNGQCGDYEEYSFKVGYVRGLRQASTEARTLLKRSVGDGDDA